VNGNKKENREKKERARSTNQKRLMFFVPGHTSQISKRNYAAEKRRRRDSREMEGEQDQQNTNHPLYQ
jgi:hypothetical protein